MFHRLQADSIPPAPSEVPNVSHVNLLAAIKARVALWPAWGGQMRVQGGLSDWTQWHTSQADYDYVAAAGELHRNGVVMACASWVMRAFPEAQLQVVKEEPTTGEEN